MEKLRAESFWLRDSMRFCGSLLQVDAKLVIRLDKMLFRFDQIKYANAKFPA